MATRAKLMKQLMQGSRPRRKMNRPSVREAQKKTKWNILRGDTVQVIERKHPECGKQGVILKVDHARDRVLVEGVNKGAHFLKPNPDLGRPKGVTVQRERSIHYSNVNLVDPVTGLPTRVTKKILQDGSKVRVAKRSGAIIPRPEILTVRRRPKSVSVTASDTSSDDDVWEVTYVSPEEIEKSAQA